MVYNTMTSPCLVRLFSIMLCLSYSEVWAGCPSGWLRHLDSCYQFNINNTLSWNDALKACQAMNSHMLVLETQSETDYLAHKLTPLFSPADLHHDGASSVWIGGSDANNEGYWEWAGINQLIVQYTNWSPGEPDTGDGDHEEDCVSMVGHKHFQWQDRRCTERHAYICETESGAHAVG